MFSQILSFHLTQVTYKCRKLFLSIIIQQICQKEEAAELKSLLVYSTCNVQHLHLVVRMSHNRNSTSLKQKTKSSQCPSSDCASTVGSCLRHVSVLECNLQWEH